MITLFCRQKIRSSLVVRKLLTSDIVHNTLFHSTWSVRRNGMTKHLSNYSFEFWHNLIQISYVWKLNRPSACLPNLFLLSTRFDLLWLNVVFVFYRYLVSSTQHSICTLRRIVMSLTVVKYVPEGIVLNPNNNLECIMRKNYKSFRTLIVSTFKHLFW